MSLRSPHPGACALPEIKQVRDMAAALQQYTKQRTCSLEIQNAAAAIKLRAERRMGELLAEMQREGQRQSGHGDQKSESHHVIPKLQDLGVSLNQSSACQRLAAIPEPVFEEYVAITPKDANHIVAENGNGASDRGRRSSSWQRCAGHSRGRCVRRGISYQGT